MVKKTSGAAALPQPQKKDALSGERASGSMGNETDDARGDLEGVQSEEVQLLAVGGTEEPEQGQKKQKGHIRVFLSSAAWERQ
jgi:hypothetical protein